MGNTIAAWLVATMIAWQPPGRTPWPELRDETPEQTEARYADLAGAIVAVAYDPDNGPIFRGPRGRGKTAALLLSIAWMESAFYNRVTSTRGKLDRSDHGRSWCAGQVWLGHEGDPLPAHYRRIVPEEWTGPELEADPVRCMTVAYRLARMSFSKCQGRAPLASYTGEPCDRAPKARNRLKRALTLFPPEDDASVLGALRQEPAEVSLTL